MRTVKVRILPPQPESLSEDSIGHALGLATVCATFSLQPIPVPTQNEVLIGGRSVMKLLARSGRSHAHLLRLPDRHHRPRPRLDDWLGRAVRWATPGSRANSATCCRLPVSDNLPANFHQHNLSVHLSLGPFTTLTGYRWLLCCYVVTLSRFS
jgi:hypothetical protein